ncbi:lysostaphin resistance A-like protein [Thalassotalea aquiviva]|uniref:CPBP family intramembrane glutamic endopeptidase n=1 Tax=Thalassotalea aquiviva TaxID=3242415 RepID=UPI00352A1D4A
MENNLSQSNVNTPWHFITPLLFLASTMLLMLMALYFIESGQLGKPAVLIGLFGPAIMAVLFSYIGGGWHQARQLLKQYIVYRVSLGYYAIALLLMPTLIYITMLFTDFTGLAYYENWFRSVSMGQLIFIPLISIGEELGWRGYLQPLFRQKYSLAVASTFVGCLWALWHITGYYFNTGVVEGLPFYLFFIWVVGASLIMGYLYEKTQSVLLAVIFHSSVNFSLNIFLINPEFSGSVLPFSILTLLVCCIGLAFVRYHAKTR